MSKYKFKIVDIEVKTCKICKREFSNLVGLTKHITQNHKIKSKEYYDKFYKKENEGKCLECDKNTTFVSFGKYRKHCSHKCSTNSKEVQKRIKIICKNKYGTEYPTQNKTVQEKIKRTCKNKYGFESWAKSLQAREIHRKNRIKQIEIQHNNNEPLHPCIGKTERKCLNELQKYCKYKIKRNFKMGGYFPDGFLNKLKLCIEFDEKYHYSNRQIKRDFLKNKYFKSIGCVVFRVKEKDWVENKNEVITMFKKLIR